MKYDITPTRAARILVFMSVSFFYIWLINTGRLEYIVHPRMEVWIIAAGLLFLVLAFHQTLMLSEAPRRADPVSHFIPLLLVFLVAYLYVTKESFQPEPLQDAAQSLALNTVMAHARDVEKAANEPLPARIVLDDSTYWTLYNRLYDNPKAARGKEILVQGFLYRKKGLPSGSALVARDLMYCCSADMSMIGFLVEGSGLPSIPDGTWVAADGTLGSVAYDISGTGKAIPVPLVHLASVKQVKRNSSQIIYPY